MASDSKLVFPFTTFPKFKNRDKPDDDLDIKSRFEEDTVFEQLECGNYWSANGVVLCYDTDKYIFIYAYDGANFYKCITLAHGDYKITKIAVIDDVLTIYYK